MKRKLDTHVLQEKPHEADARASLDDLDWELIHEVNWSSVEETTLDEDRNNSSDTGHILAQRTLLGMRSIKFQDSRLCVAVVAWVFFGPSFARLGRSQQNAHNSHVQPKHSRRARSFVEYTTTLLGLPSGTKSPLPTTIQPSASAFACLCRQYCTFASCSHQNLPAIRMHNFWQTGVATTHATSDQFGG